MRQNISKKRHLLYWMLMLPLVSILTLYLENNYIYNSWNYPAPSNYIAGVYIAPLEQIKLFIMIVFSSVFHDINPIHGSPDGSNYTFGNYVFCVLYNAMYFYALKFVIRLVRAVKNKIRRNAGGESSSPAI